jgi:hypothetical protein
MEMLNLGLLKDIFMQKQNNAQVAKKRTILWAAIFGASMVMAAGHSSLAIAQQQGAAVSKQPASTVSVMVNADKQDAKVSKAEKPAQVQMQATTQAAETLPVLNIPVQSNNDLAEYSRLTAEKRKLELMKDIAKLKKEREEIETGAKSDKQTEKDAMIQNLQMQLASKSSGPSQSQVSYDSVTVLAIFGSGQDMIAKIYTDSGIMSVEVGAKLPSGEIVQSIKDGGVTLVKGKSSRRLTPTAEKPIASSDKSSPVSQYPGSPPQASQANGPGTSPFSGPPPQYIPPFDPAELMGKPSTVKTSNGASGQQPSGL